MSTVAGPWCPRAEVQIPSGARTVSISSMSEATLTIGEPRLWHDTIVGFDDGGSVRVPLADVTDLTVFKVSRPHSTDTGVGKALLGGAALVYLFYASLDFGGIGDAMAKSISR